VLLSGSEVHGPAYSRQIALRAHSPTRGSDSKTTQFTQEKCKTTRRTLSWRIEKLFCARRSSSPRLAAIRYPICPAT